MSTIIYPSPIFGPVKSRRLGLSLGINLLPADGKVCTFDCIYCECGSFGMIGASANAGGQKLKAAVAEGTVMVSFKSEAFESNNVNPSKDSGPTC